MTRNRCLISLAAWPCCFWLIAVHVRYDAWLSSRWHLGTSLLAVPCDVSPLRCVVCTLLFDAMLAMSSTLPLVSLPPPCPTHLISKMTKKERTKTKRSSSRHALQVLLFLLLAYFRPGSSCMGTSTEPDALSNIGEHCHWCEDGCSKSFFYRRRRRRCVRSRAGSSHATIILRNESLGICL